MDVWKRTFAAIWVANLVTAVGMMSFLPFFPTYLRELDVPEEHLAAWTGIVFGAAPLAAAFASPIWGALGDRFGRRLMVLRAMAAIALFVGCMGFVRTPVELLALRLLQGVFSGFVPPSITLVSVGAPSDRQGRVASSLQIAMAIGAVLGPPLGAFVEAHLGMRATFGVVAILAGASGLCVLIFAREEAAQRQARAGRLSAWGALRGSLSDLAELRHNPRLRTAVALLFSVQFCINATNPQLQLFVEELRPDAGASVAPLTAALFTVLALTNLVGLPLWGRYGDRRGYARALWGAAWIAAAGLFVHGVAPSYAWLHPGRVLLGIAIAGIGPAAFGIAAVETAVERRGGAMGAVFSARALGVGLAAPVGGVLAAAIGIRALFLIEAGAVALVLVALRRSRSARPADEARRAA